MKRILDDFGLAQHAGKDGNGMTSRRIELISMLERELDVLEKGGYGTPSGTGRQPSKVFEDSLACINHWLVPGHSPEVCNGCILLDFVPAEKRQEQHACRFIPLNQRGDTVASLTGAANHARLEDAVRGWLKSAIEKLRKMPDDAAEGEDVSY